MALHKFKKREHVSKDSTEWTPQTEKFKRDRRAKERELKNSKKFNYGD